MLFTMLTESINGDVWSNPTIKYYSSDNGKYILKVVPRYVPENYYKWLDAKPKRKSKFSPSDTITGDCHAILYQILDVGDTLELWNRKLVNYTSPVDAAVSNDGAFVVTFNDWYMSGYGCFVMCVYNRHGDVIFNRGLAEISPVPINDFIYSISSIWWYCGAAFEQQEKPKLRICFSISDTNQIERSFDLIDLEFINNDP